jgi:adenylate cyclase class IV
MNHTKNLIEHKLYINTTTNKTKHKLYMNHTKNLKDTKGVIRIRISKNRQHNGQKRKYKRTNDLQNIPIKLKIE